MCRLQQVGFKPRISNTPNIIIFQFVKQKMSWFIKSQALVRSKNIATTCKFLSKAWWIFSIKVWQAVSVDSLTLKPFCSTGR